MVGLGIMGAGIAELLVRSGRAVVVTEASRNALASGLPTLHTSLGKAVAGTGRDFSPPPPPTRT